jgi:hypothetical protein
MQAKICLKKIGRQICGLFLPRLRIDDIKNRISIYSGCQKNIPIGERFFATTTMLGRS